MLEIPEMRFISIEIEDMGKLECSSAIRDSQTKREKVGSQPFYTTLFPGSTLPWIASISSPTMHTVIAQS